VLGGEKDLGLQREYPRRESVHLARRDAFPSATQARGVPPIFVPLNRVELKEE